MSKYKCENCLEEFETGWSDEEASLEFSNRFPGSDIRHGVLVCEDCYKLLAPMEDPDAEQ